MSGILQKIKQLSPEEIQEQISLLSSQYSLEESDNYTAEDIQEIYKLYSLYLLNVEIEEGARVFQQIKPLIDTFLEKQPKNELVLEILTEWNFIAIEHTQEQLDEFVCMPLYEEIFSAYQQGGGEFHLKEAQAKLQLIHHSRYWIANGGNMESLNESQRNFLTDLNDTYLDQLTNQLTLFREAGEWAEAVGIERALASFYQHITKPKQAVDSLKYLLEDLPKLATHIPEDLAEIYMEIGRLFLQNHKPKTAIKYFQRAQTIYRSSEEAELYLFQTEGWIEECKKMTP